MRLIVALGVAGFISGIAFTLLAPASPGSLSRVRRARGLSREWRSALLRVPLLGRWQPVDAETLRLAGFTEFAPTDVAGLKCLCALLLALVSAAVGAPGFVTIGAAYAGFVAPTIWIERRAHSRITTGRAAVLPLVERLAALAASGHTVEHAFVKVQDGAGPLVPLLRQTSTAAALGISPFEACADLAQHERLDSLRDLCGALAAARRGGRPLVPVLLERREVLRLAWRAERLEAASRVDGALSLVLILAYLPALLLLVVVPLFVGLLAALES